VKGLVFLLVSLLATALCILGNQGCTGVEGTKQYQPTRLSLVATGDTEWVLKAWDSGAPAPPNPEVTLIYRDGQFSGKSGCNRFFSPVKDGDIPGDISVGLAGSTKMACSDSAMAVEDRFLGLLSSVKKFSFTDMQLALSYEKDGVWGVMLFERRKTQPTGKQ
jgi:heat shock protein HslJ